MPIDNEGIIYIKNGEKNVKSEKKIKNLGLLISSFVAIIGCIISLCALHIQKLQYENNLKELELEKEKYESMLRESNIQIATSYVICEVRDIEDLYSWIEGYNVRIYSNDLTNLFYDIQTHHYCDEKDDYLFIDEGAGNTYNWIYSEVVFLKIDIISNRVVKDINFDYCKINMENNINAYEDNFSSCISSYEENGENITVNLGDAFPNDTILIPLELRHPIYYRNSGNKTWTIYKMMYIPQNISFYDELYENTFTFEIRDLLDGGFITEFGFYGQG